MKRYMIYCGGLVVCMAAVCAICVIAFGRTPGQDRDQEFQAAGTDGEGLEPEAEPEGPSGDAKEAEGEEKAGTDAAMSGMTAPEEAQADEEVGSAAPSGAPGPLSIEGTQLVDSAGNPVQLKGISTHGLAWYPDYVNAECFRQLREDWGMNVVRLAMYTGESGGFCTDGDREGLKDLVERGVGYAAECGMYAIIDWHILSDGNPNTHLREAEAFFAEMSEAYGESTNVLYEICNEPNGDASWQDVKDYAEHVIGTIRENDPDGIILVGTPNWCQYVDQAAADPITGYDNIMYTLHFYAATHGDSLRDSMAQAVEAGLPVFVSEYGICDASGNGAIDREQADEWVEAMDGYGISYVAWNLSNKAEASAILKSSCNKTSGFAWEDLSDSGRWLYDMLERQGAGGGFSGSGTAGGDAVDDSASGREVEDGSGRAEASEGNGGGSTAGEDTEISAGALAESGHVGAPDQSEDSTEALEVEAKVVNSWGEGEETCFQYDLSLTNLSDALQDGWRIRLAFDCDITLENGWNGKYEVQGNVLIISSMDYNGKIEKGGSAEDVGFIIRADEGCRLEDIVFLS